MSTDLLVEKASGSKELEKLLKETQARINTLNDELVNGMDGLDEVQAGSRTLLLQDTSRKRIVVAALRRLYPEIAEEVTVTTTRKRLTIP